MGFVWFEGAIGFIRPIGFTELIKLIGFIGFLGPLGLIGFIGAIWFP